MRLVTDVGISHKIQTWEAKYVDSHGQNSNMMFIVVVEGWCCTMRGDGIYPKEDKESSTDFP